MGQAMSRMDDAVNTAFSDGLAGLVEIYDRHY
jgi:hypothetical protein